MSFRALRETHTRLVRISRQVITSHVVQMHDVASTDRGGCRANDRAILEDLVARAQVASRDLEPEVHVVRQSYLHAIDAHYITARQVRTGDDNVVIIGQQE